MILTKSFLFFLYSLPKSKSYQIRTLKSTLNSSFFLIPYRRSVNKFSEFKLFNICSLYLLPLHPTDTALTQDIFGCFQLFNNLETVDLPLFSPILPILPSADRVILLEYKPVHIAPFQKCFNKKNIVEVISPPDI